MNYNIFKSRTFWTAVALVLYNALVQYPAGSQAATFINPLINFVGLVLVTYFHVNPSQNYNDQSVEQGSPKA